jgi:hypothetical protein
LSKKISSKTRTALS